MQKNYEYRRQPSNAPVWFLVLILGVTIVFLTFKNKQESIIYVNSTQQQRTDTQTDVPVQNSFTIEFPELEIPQVQQPLVSGSGVDSITAGEFLDTFGWGPTPVWADECHPPLACAANDFGE
jgi:hypothetical protein